MSIDVIDLTQSLVKCASVTPVDDGAMNVVIEALEPMGFTCTRLKFGDTENLFARRGSEGPHLSYAGHTDVVPPGNNENWTLPPFTANIVDGKIYGRGTSDMKGSIAAFIAAVSSIPEGKGSISLIITGDEEGPATDGTVKVLDWMKKNNHIPDVAIVGEPTNPDQMGDEIKIGRRGSLSGTITVHGIQGHVAYPHRAYNPIPKLAQMIDALSSLEIDEGSDHFEPTTFQVTNIHVGNPANNIIPGEASARFNIRYNDLWTAERLEENIRDLLDLIGPDYTMTLTHGAECFLTEAGPFTELVSDAVKAVTGRVPKLGTGGGTSDARFIQKYCPVIECGSVNKTIHQIDEFIAIDDLKALEKIYKKILQSYFA